MSKWPTVPISRFLKSITRPERVEDLETYKVLGAHWYAHGLYVKDTRPGVEIQAPKVYRVKEGDFVYNRLFAWKGSFAVAGPDVNDCVVSNEFPCFEIDSTQIVPDFLWHYFRRESTWNDALGLSSGGTPTSRNRLKEGDFLSLEIPLPPHAEQKRIVEWLNALATRAEEVKGLVEQTNREIDDVSRSILWSNELNATPTRMSDLVEQRTPDVQVAAHDSYTFAGVYCFGRGIFVGQTKSGMDFKYPKLTRLRAGNFTYPKLMAWEGAFGVVPEECDGLVVSTEFPVFEIDENKVLPEVLDLYFKTPSIWPKVAGASTGTNVRRRRLNPKDFLKFKFPLPPMAVQQKIAEVRSRTEEALTERKKTINELDGLTKSVLNQVFNGNEAA